MQIEYWPIDKPIDYPKNARVWSKHAIAKVADSIRAYGFRQPIVVDKHGVICIGHLRRAAARTIPLETVPVHVASDLTAEQIRGLRLMDNRSAQEATFDLEALGAEFLELKALDFDLSLTGFDLREIDAFTLQPNAAEFTGRICYGLEIDPAYTDIIITRWQNLTGKQATLDGHGATFEHVKFGRRQAAEDALKEEAINHGRNSGKAAVSTD